MDAAGIESAIIETHAGNVKEIYDLNNQLFMIDMLNTSKENLFELINHFNTNEKIVYTSPVLLDETGREIGGYTNQVLVRLKAEADYSLLIESITVH